MEMAGTLRRVYATEKSVLPVGFAIAFVGSPEETPPEDVEVANAELLALHQTSTALDLDLKRNLAERLQARRVRATPAGRRVARESAVELEAVAQWLGAERVVDEGDVRAYLDRPAEGEPPRAR